MATDMVDVPEVYPLIPVRPGQQRQPRPREGQLPRREDEKTRDKKKRDRYRRGHIDEYV